MLACSQDISPLENMHASGSFQMAASAPEKDFAAGLPVDIRNALRASIIELILGKSHHMCTYGLRVMAFCSLLAKFQHPLQ